MAQSTSSTASSQRARAAQMSTQSPPRASRRQAAKAGSESHSVRFTSCTQALIWRAQLASAQAEPQVPICVRAVGRRKSAPQASVSAQASSQLGRGGAGTRQALRLSQASSFTQEM